MNAQAISQLPLFAGLHAAPEPPKAPSKPYVFTERHKAKMKLAQAARREREAAAKRAERRALIQSVMNERIAELSHEDDVNWDRADW